MVIWVEPLEWDAEKEGKEKSMAESKAEKDTKDTEQAKLEEAEENAVKKPEPPIVQIEVEVQNFIAGEPVRASRAIGVAPHENCASSFIYSIMCADIIGGRDAPLVHLA